MNKYIVRLASLTVFAALVLAPVAAAAQGRGREGGGRGGGGREPGGQRGGGGGRGEGQGRSAQGPGARPESRAVPRERAQAPRQAPQQAPQQVRPNDRRDDRPNDRPNFRPNARPNVRQNDRPVQRYNGPQRVAPRHVAPPRYSPPPRYSSPRYSSPNRYYSNRPVYRPYYSFVPRLRLGFGLYLGNAVPFPSWYDPYMPGAYSSYRPGVAYGGVSFDIQPYDAAIYIDGNYAGVADEFSPVRAPMTLPAGRHRIDIEAPGYAPLSFDITVVPRQVIPYHGALGR